MSSKLDKTIVNSVIAVDRNYVPMMEVARRKAIRAVSTGRAMVLNPANLDRHLDLAGGIVLIIFPNAKACAESKLLMGRLDRRVMKRDHYLCQYEGCHNRADTIDHIVPLCQGGRTTWQNLVACCHECNRKKGNALPQECGMRPAKEPRPFSLHTSRQLMRMMGRSDAKWRKYLYY